MSGYAKMRKLWIHREFFQKSQTTGQQRLQRYEAIPFHGMITQNNGSRTQDNDQKQYVGAFQLATFYRGVQKGDKIADSDITYTVTYIDLPRPSGPKTYQLERVDSDG